MFYSLHILTSLFAANLAINKLSGNCAATTVVSGSHAQPVNKYKNYIRSDGAPPRCPTYANADAFSQHDLAARATCVMRQVSEHLIKLSGAQKVALFLPHWRGIAISRDVMLIFRAGA